MTSVDPPRLGWPDGPRVEAAARASYRGEDLREAYAHGRALLASR